MNKNIGFWISIAILFLLIFICGCQLKVIGYNLVSLEKPQSEVAVFHPIDKEDFFPVLKGTKIENIVIDRNGFFVSEEYVKEVMGVRVAP